MTQHTPGVMIHHRYYVGTETRHGHPVTPEAQDKVAGELVAAYGGYTLYTAAGAWRNDAGVVVSETTCVFECVNADKVVNPAAMAALLANLAEQATVLWTETTVKGGFES